MRSVAFGWPCDDDRLQPEKRSNSPLTSDEIAAIFAAYQALDIRSGGRYGRFLREAARCSLCADDANISLGKQPIPLLCGKAGLDGTPSAAFRSAHEGLEAYRHETPSGTAALRLCMADPGGIGSLRSFLENHGLAGLSVGHCGWGDLTARIRGEQLGEGVDALILGADWYPLTQCSNFLLDRYSIADTTLKKFWRLLGVREEDVVDFFRGQRAYLGNTLLCYRTGWEVKGTANLSPRSFKNCREHLERHVDALEPRVIVTFGREPARSISWILTGASEADEAVLDQFRREPAIKNIMAKFYEDDERAGVCARRGERPIRFVPLCHPSMPNRYPGDYEALRHILLLPRYPSG